MTDRVSVRLDDETARMLDTLVVWYGVQKSVTYSDMVRTAIRFLWRDTFGWDGPPRNEDEEEQ